MQSLQIPSNGTKFPLSSPGADDQFSIVSGNTYRSHDPAPSPYSTGNPFADDESDTSGQDEFHLERYSQGLDQAERQRNNESKQAGKRSSQNYRSESPRKRPRPGLNIITDFPLEPERPSNGLVLERVQKKRPRPGSRAAASIKSQKAQHFYAVSRSIAAQHTGFVNLNDISGTKKPRKDGSRQKHGLGFKLATHLTRSGAGQPGLHADQNSPADRSIVIGISVPEDQVDAYKPHDPHSALTLYTPATPQIIVTPAQEEELWNSNIPADPRTRLKRPASSIYSQIVHTDKYYEVDKEVPPLPTIPKNHAFHLLPKTQHSHQKAEDLPHQSSGKRPISTGTVFDDEDEIGYPGAIRQRSGSMGSQEQILPDSGNTARPKSTGWWNLGLSPLLSRAGTIRSKISPSEPSPMPQMPNISKVPNDDASDMHEPMLSPETPRRLGLGSRRASTWSNWTEWEIERERANPASHTTIENADIDWKGHKAQDSSATVPFMIGPTPIVKGLAAEYFTACAFDQRGATPYFECQNHSCAEQLPKLVSVHDKGVSVDAFDPEANKAIKLALNNLEGGPKTPVNQHARSDSNSTAIEDEANEFSPNIRRADIATIMKPTLFAPAKSFNTKEGVEMNQDKSLASLPEPGSDQKATPVPAYSPPRPVAKLRTIGTVKMADLQPSVTSPGPLSPEMQKSMAPRGAVPMSEVQPLQQARSNQPAPIFINNYTNYPDLPLRSDHAPVSLADIQRHREPREKIERQRQRLEKEDEVIKEAGGLWRGRGCFPKNGCFGRDGPEGRKKRRWYIMIAAGLLAIIITSIVLAITLTREGDGTPIQSQWLNLTGFPPVPTGISTIIRPDVQDEDTSCVQPSTLWSCAVPKEDQSIIAPNDPDQPNFRFEIRFRNGTVPANETVPLNGTGSKSTANDPFTNDLFTPSPSTPSLSEQSFLGNTTDNITAPLFSGEDTPFYITFVDTNPVVPPSFNSSSKSRILARQSSISTSTSSSDPASAIPAPDLAPDGSAAPANLLPDSPFPSSQPLHLYNRGESTEHYGFYTYYDKSIFLTTTSVLNGTPPAGTDGVLPQDQNGGASKNSAIARCTFSQTRFLVQIWTSPEFNGVLLTGSAASSTTSSASAAAMSSNSATDFTPPGSFPYPVTITVDRHGGDKNKKGVFCYGMDGGEIVVDEKFLEAEERGSGGTIINSVPGFITGSGGGGFDTSLGGIDGGTGGCRCAWTNFQPTN